MRRPIRGVVVSVASEFIENADAAVGKSAAQVKQDCELKTFDRLAPCRIPDWS
jgi:hypothetical protein